MESTLHKKGVHRHLEELAVRRLEYASENTSFFLQCPTLKQKFTLIRNLLQDHVVHDVLCLLESCEWLLSTWHSLVLYIAFQQGMLLGRLLESYAVTYKLTRPIEHTIWYVRFSTSRAWNFVPLYMLSSVPVSGVYDLTWPRCWLARTTNLLLAGC